VQLYEALIGQVNSRLAPYERIRRFCLLERELQLESGEVTPTMKVKRSVVTRAYAPLITAMLQDPPPPGVGCPITDAQEPHFDPASRPM
jgi:long-chain acyl-CoA synthetase